MSALFDRFAKMAKEEFGCTVKRVENNGETFESLFGISKEILSKYELPYNIPTTQSIYSDKPVLIGLQEMESLGNCFEIEKYFSFAA